MGAAALLHTLCDYPIQPAGICIECPFGNMYQTTCARFKLMKAPIFPMAGLLVFWGGVENGFWAFSLNPAEFAKSVHCPALLIYGGKDEKVSLEETQTIFKNMQGKKSLKIYPLAAHDNYLTQYKSEWIQDQQAFLNSLN
jgi:pimeloyl-ACP methyl ester carboxylesterase